MLVVQQQWIEQLFISKLMDSLTALGLAEVSNLGKRCTCYNTCSHDARL